MTFYEQVRSFFKKYDPSRIRLAKKIAVAYKTPSAQKAVMKRLNEVYAAGGPGKFDFSSVKEVAPKKVEKIEKAEQKVESIEVANDADDVVDLDGLEEVAD